MTTDTSCKSERIVEIYTDASTEKSSEIRLVIDNDINLPSRDPK